MSHPAPRVGVAVIIVREGLVLLGLRTGSRGAGTWAPPGGHLEHGESVEQCAVREALEETGLQIHDLSQGPRSDDVIEGKRYVSRFVVAPCASGDARVLEPEKCAQWQWFRWSELPEPLFQPLASVRATGYIPHGVD